MKLLMTGAGGQLGTDALEPLLARGHAVIPTDLTVPRPERRAGLEWRALDVAKRDDIENAIRDVRPDVVFHLAAILSARGEANPALTYDVNQNGTYHVLEACRRYGVKQVIFISTIAVYGPGLPDPTPEDVPLWPSTMYGVTKASGELLCEYYFKRFGLDVRGVRFPGLIGPTLPGGGTSDYALYMYTEGLRTGHYQAFCRPDTRIPLMYMPDAVRSLIELMEAPRQRLSRCIYNVAAFSPTAAEIAASVRRGVGQVEITFAPDPHRQAILDSWPRALDDGCARRDWGWQPEYTLEEMTEDLVPKIRALLREPNNVLAPAGSHGAAD